LFALGAAVPVAPFFFWEGNVAIAVSVALSAGAMAAIGGGTSIFTGRNVVWSAARQLLLGLAAAAITYGVGKIAGVSLS
jgi:VIT1/CCC1 family predicted Fe2+/Mn2+ transporter